MDRNQLVDGGNSNCKETDLASGLWFVLGRRSIGEIECDGSSDRDDQGSHKSSGKAQRSNVAVVQEGQENRGDYGQGKAQHVTLQIDRFAWLALRVLHEHLPIFYVSL